MLALEEAVRRGWGDVLELLFPAAFGPIRAPQVEELLDALKRQVRGPLLGIWGRLPAHRSALVRRYVKASRGRIVVEFLPACAPE